MDIVARLKLADMSYHPLNFDAAKEIQKLRKQRDTLLAASKALVERWDTPNWKDAPHTGEFIAVLREVINQIEKDES